MIHRRLLVAVVVGVAASFIPLGPAHGVAPHSLTGFIVGGIVFAVPLLVHVMGHDALATQRHVEGRDGDRAWYDVVVIIVGLASLAGVGILLIGGQSKGSASVIDAVIGLLAVAVGWLSIHTMYVLRYARLYYASKDPPVDFNMDADPAFSDFAYLAFTLGMTYQVSDTNISSSEVRRVILGQTLLAYVYGTVVIAATINLLAGLGASASG